ncbi:integrase catalytic domain-containing protein [Trichonephila clavipes]|nr:integrase catalytic domain-containing protein [Trichonephila clavipes]
MCCSDQAHDNTETQTVCMSSSVKAYSQGHISSKDADRVHAVVIQQLSKDFQWKLISSEVNPADVLSRGLDVKELAANDLWWKGPDLQNMAVATPNS